MSAFDSVGMDAIGMAASDVGAADPQPSTVAGVTVSLSAVTLAGGATQQFTASVLGLNSPSQSVTWTASAGTVDASGLFTAPAATPGHQYITVTATSVADTSKWQSAIVTIPGTSPPILSGIFQSRRHSSRRVQRFS